MITFSDPKLKRFQSDLRTFARDAVPFANRESINDAAFMTKKVTGEVLRKRMILRSTWASRRVGVQKAKQKRVRDQFAIVGGEEEFHERQEFGGVTYPTAKHGVPIPTRRASNEGEGSTPRKRRVVGPKSLRQIRLRKVKNVMQRKRRNAIHVQSAAGSGNKFVFLKTQRGVGIFKIEGKRDSPKVRMLWDLSKPSVTTPRNPWLKPSVEIVRPRLPGIYRKNLKKQLQRRRIFAR